MCTRQSPLWGQVRILGRHSMLQGEPFWASYEAALAIGALATRSGPQDDAAPLSDGWSPALIGWNGTY